MVAGGLRLRLPIAVITVVGALGACAPAPAYVLVEVRDPDGLATEAVAIAYGAELGELQRFDIDTGVFPLSFVVTSDEEQTVLAWIDALDAGGVALARGRRLDQRSGSFLRLSPNTGTSGFNRLPDSKFAFASGVSGG